MQHIAWLYLSPNSKVFIPPHKVWHPRLFITLLALTMAQIELLLSPNPLDNSPPRHLPPLEVLTPLNLVKVTKSA